MSDSKTIYHVGAWDRNLGDLAIQMAMHHALGQGELDISWVPIDCQAGPMTDAWVNGVNEHADMVIVGGGGLLWNKPELESGTGWQWDYTWAQLEALRVPLVVYGLGFTEFPYRQEGRTEEHDNFVDSVMELLDVAKLFSVRNRYTRDFLTQGMEPPLPIEVIPDPALFLPAPMWDVSVLGAPPGLPTGRPVISICWGSDKVDWRWPNGRHSELLFLGRLVDALEGLVRGSNAHVVLVPHIAGLDDGVAALLEGELGSSNFTYAQDMLPDLEQPNWNTLQAALLIYGRSQVVLSMRKHGLLMAGSQGRYMFGLGDLEEVGATMAELGYGKSVLRSDTPAGVMAGMIAQPMKMDYNTALLDRQRFIFRAFNEKVLELLEGGP